jgi:hypothetical protein
MIYETDTDYLLIWTGTSWKYLTPGQDTIPGQWTSFTPVFTFGVTAAAVSSSYGFYTQIGKWVHLNAGFVSSGSQGSGAWVFTLPSGLEIAEGRVYQRIGNLYLYDGSPATQYSSIPYVAATDGKYLNAFSVSGSGVALSNTSPFTWAVNDELDLSITFKNV